EVAYVAAVRDLALAAPEALAPMRLAAVAAARRATWDDVLGRFEARLQDTLDATETSPTPVPVVA
ncbi:MAG: hypothetical protein M3R22_12485, partial [Pseudomonadota bacterium]|nr:hypothetical protein [Pseudomonadota bacterium]